VSRKRNGHRMQRELVPRARQEGQCFQPPIARTPCNVDPSCLIHHAGRNSVSFLSIPHFSPDSAIALLQPVTPVGKAAIAYSNSLPNDPMRNHGKIHVYMGGLQHSSREELPSHIMQQKLAKTSMAPDIASHCSCSALGIAIG